MKKLATLLLAAGMVLGGFAGAQAVDWKVKGTWEVEMGLYDGLSFSKYADRSGRVSSTDRTRWTDSNSRGLDKAGRKNRTGSGGNFAGKDNFQTGQRFNTQIDAVASEYLRGSLHLEMGDYQWGNTGTLGTRQYNGSIGQRGNSIGVREAFLDWFAPGTELRIRMGIQRVDNPSLSLGPMVLGQDLPGIVASTKFSDQVGLTVFWVRPFNDNYVRTNETATYGTSKNGNADNADFFAVALPVTLDGVKIIPWGVYGFMGPNVTRPNDSGAGSTGNWQDLYQSSAFTNAPGNRYGAVTNGLLPAYYSTNNPKRIKGDTTLYWVGLTGELTMADPLRVAWDINYGSTQWDGPDYLNRTGYVINALVEYKLDFGVPGLIFWYGSGDDSDPKNGSEQMPMLDINDPNFQASTFGFNGSPQMASPESVLGTGFYTGSWGLGLRVRDMSFVDKLKHTFRLNLFGGTNDPAMAKYILGRKVKKNTVASGGYVNDFNSSLGTSGGGMYLTTQDYGVEVNLDHSYKIYDNLEMIVEMGYIHLMLDNSKSVWGNDKTGAGRYGGVNVTDAMKASVFFKYSF